MDNNILKHFINVGLGAVINVLLGLITTPLITRIVNPIEYGQLNIFDTYSGIILSVIYFGLDYALIRFFYDNDSIKTKSGLIKYCVLLPSITATAIFALAFILLKLNIINFKYSDFIFVLLFANVLASIWQKFTTIVLRLTYQSKNYSLCIIFQKIVYCLAIVFGAILFKKHYLEILILATIISFVAVSLLAIYFTNKYWRFNEVSLPINKKEIITYGLPLIIFALTLTLLDSIDKLFIDHFCSEYEVGLYSSAFTLISLLSLLQTTFNTLWMPAQTEQFVKNPNDVTFIQKGNKYITIIMFFIGLNLIMFKDLFCYLLGESYRTSAEFMPFLIISVMMYTISDTTCSGIDLSKKSYLNIIVAGVPCLLSFVLLYILVPRLGAKGAAISKSLASIAYIAIRTSLSNKYYYIDYDVKKFIIILILTTAFSYVCTFYSNQLVIVPMFIVTMLIFFVLYYQDIMEMIMYFKNTIFVKNKE